MCQRPVTGMVGSKFFIHMKMKVKVSLCYLYPRRKSTQCPVNRRLSESQSCREDKLLAPSGNLITFPQTFSLYPTDYSG